MFRAITVSGLVVKRNRSSSHMPQRNRRSSPNHPPLQRVVWHDPGPVPACMFLTALGPHDRRPAGDQPGVGPSSWSRACPCPSWTAGRDSPCCLCTRLARTLRRRSQRRRACRSSWARMPCDTSFASTPRSPCALGRSEAPGHRPSTGGGLDRCSRTGNSEAGRARRQLKAPSSRLPELRKWSLRRRTHGYVGRAGLDP
jgi:hypothetical protein